MQSEKVPSVLAEPRKHILCIDDHPDLSDLLLVALPGYAITSAGTIEAGLQSAKTQLFDLYLLDNWLPDGSGIELCRQIRAFDRNSPIVFISAAAYEEDHQAALDA